MTAREVKRKLTAILSADVKGYNRLMEETRDEYFYDRQRPKEVNGG